MPIFLEPMFWPRADVWQDLQITNSSLPLPDKNKVGSNFYWEPFVQVSHTKDFSKNLAWYSALLCKQRQKQLYNIKNSYYFLLVPKMDILLKAALKISKRLFLENPLWELSWKCTKWWGTICKHSWQYWIIWIINTE